MPWRQDLRKPELDTETSEKCWARSNPVEVAKMLIIRFVGGAGQSADMLREMALHDVYLLLASKVDYTYAL